MHVQLKAVDVLVFWGRKKLKLVSCRRRLVVRVSHGVVADFINSRCYLQRAFKPRGPEHLKAQNAWTNQFQVLQSSTNTLCSEAGSRFPAAPQSGATPGKGNLGASVPRTERLFFFSRRFHARLPHPPTTLPPSHPRASELQGVDCHIFGVQRSGF